MQYVEMKQIKVAKYADSIVHQWRKFPVSLQVAITDYCFNQCITCGHWKRNNKQHMQLQQYLDFLQYGRDHGLTTVCYSGGDPFAYPHFNEVMSWHVNDNMKFGIITSGHVPQSIDKNLMIEAEWIRISIDSIRNALTMRPGIYFSKVDSTISFLMANNVKVGVGTTLHKYNLKGFEEICNYVLSAGIQEHRVWLVQDRKDLSIEDQQYLLDMLYIMELAYHRKGISNNFSDVADIIRDGKEQMNFKHCYAVFYQLFVGADGNIWPCCVMAGDTQSFTRCTPIGHINDPISIGKALCEYSNLSIDHLPKACKELCTLRLSSINNYFLSERGGDFF